MTVYVFRENGKICGYSNRRQNSLQSEVIEDSGHKGFNKADYDEFQDFLNKEGDYLPDYAIRRGSEYPKYGDQLDAIWKFINAYKDAGNPIPKDVQDQIDSVNQVKANHPKN